MVILDALTIERTAETRISVPLSFVYVTIGNSGELADLIASAPKSN